MLSLNLECSTILSSSAKCHQPLNCSLTVDEDQVDSGSGCLSMPYAYLQFQSCDVKDISTSMGSCFCAMHMQLHSGWLM